MIGVVKMKFTVNIQYVTMVTHRLKKSGDFKKFSENPFLLMIDDFTFDSYGEAEQWKQSQSKIDIDGVITEFNTDGSNIREPYVVIRSHRINKPQQKIFTREQLRNTLQNGDDSVTNSLIIDKEGYIRIVPFEIARDADYPVRFETFSARQGYVGSDYHTHEIEEMYMTLLGGWAEHLASGIGVYRHYLTVETEEELLKKIDLAIQKYQ